MGKTVKKDSFDLITVRIRADRSIAISKPCNHCIRIIKSFPVGQVWYSNREGSFTCESAREIENTHLTARARLQLIYD